jgi:hypothetical chaperone protein
MTRAVAYGIDFGTTNSAVAVAYADRVEILKIAPAPFPELLKSVLYLNRNRQELAGQEAISQYSYTAVAQTRCSSCHLAHFSRAGIVSECKWAAHGGGCADSRIVFGAKQFLAQGHVNSTHSWGRDFTLSYLAAVVVRRLKSLADAQLNERVDRVVIGHPVRFSGEETIADHERGLARLVEAARGAGFVEVELMDEPLAAHLAIDHPSGPVLTLDFGGGTFDVVVIDGASNRVLSKRGLAIAGEEFDALLFDAKLAQRLGLDEPGVPSHFGQSIRSLGGSCFLLGNPKSLNELVTLSAKVRRLSELIAIINGGHLVALHQAIETAKIELSRRQVTSIVLERRGITLDIAVTRQEFDIMIAPSLTSIRNEVVRAIQDAGIQMADVTAVNLTGGSSQIPAFVALVRDLFGTVRIEEARVFDTVVNGLAEWGRVHWRTEPADRPSAKEKIPVKRPPDELPAHLATKSPGPDTTQVSPPTYGKAHSVVRSPVPDRTQVRPTAQHTSAERVPVSPARAQIRAAKSIYSEDGCWRWDGHKWQSRYSNDGKKYWTEKGWVAAHSPDLNWWWNGTKWQSARSRQWWWNGRAWVQRS